MLKKLFIKTLPFLVLLTLTNPAFGKILYTLDFTTQKDGPANQWFKKNGFKLEKDSSKIEATFSKGRLIFKTPKNTLGLFAKEFNKKDYINNVKKIRIVWGMNNYPSGANWDKGVIREGIAVITSFGEQKIDSGSFYIPNVPYFIGLFLGKDEIENKPYTGTYWKKGSRYICVKPCNNPVNKTVTTIFDLSEKFKVFFGVSPLPPVTALTIEIDVRDIGNAEAYIKSIEFLDK